MMTRTTAEGNGGGVLRRAMLLLAVAMMVATMALATAAPAFAVRHREGGVAFACTDGTTTETVAASSKQELEKQGYTCTKLGKRR
jgi:hypothetical protein